MTTTVRSIDTARRRPVAPPPKDPAGRPPPHDLAVEAALLDGLINNTFPPETWKAFLAALTPAHFHNPANAKVFDAIRSLVERGSPVDLPLVMSELRNVPPPGGGWQHYLSTLLVQGCYAGRPTREYIEVLDNLKRCRDGIQVCWETLSKLYDGPQSLPVIERTRADLGALAVVDGVGTARPLADVADAIHRRMERAEQRPAWGFRQFDAALGPMMGGRVTYIAARPKCGKTSFVWRIAENVATTPPDDGGFWEAAYFWSGEMAGEPLYLRQLAALERIPVSRVATGSLHKDEWQRVIDRNKAWAQLPIVLDDARKATVAQIEASFVRARDRLVAGTLKNVLGYVYPRSKQRVLVVDHLGKLAPPKDVDPRAIEPDRLRANMEALSDFAKRNDTHVIVLVHAGMDDADQAADLDVNKIRNTRQVPAEADTLLLMTAPERGRIKFVHKVERWGDPSPTPMWFCFENCEVWED